jgi:hypothetical protein
MGSDDVSVSVARVDETVFPGSRHRQFVVQDLANFFREVQEQEKQRADRAKQLLAKRLQQGG